MDYTMYKPNDASFSNANIMLTRHCPCDVKTSGGTCPYTDHNSDIPCANEYPHLTLYYDVTTTSAATQLWLTAYSGNYGEILIDDETFINTKQPYSYAMHTFDTIGIHKVKLYNEKNGFGVIAKNWFANCYRLVKIEVPETVTQFDYHSFLSCTNLESINLKRPITYLGDSAFNGCSKLTDFGYNPVILKTTNIDANNTMKGCGIEDVVVSGLTSFSGQHLFENCKKLKRCVFKECSFSGFGWNSFNGCTALETIVVDCPTPPTINAISTVFSGVPGTFYVPKESYDLYKNATNWKTFYQQGRLKTIEEYKKQRKIHPDTWRD